MLHPTPHPIPIPSPFLSHSNSLSLTHSPSPYIQVEEKDMESVQTVEEFSIDDLFDFSCDELVQIQDDQEQQTEENQEHPQQQKTVCSPQNYDIVTNNSSVTDDFGSISFPSEDLENLEWVSQFVEDSFCGYSETYPAGKSPPFSKPEQRRSEPEKPVQARNIFITPVQTKARSKRTRSGLRVWSPLTESSSTSSASSMTSVTSAKKMKKRSGNEFGGTQQPRRCSHCGVLKTPQWRAGPLGAKTLCNACGVRFKSGRLLPEYRPACSPTFSNVLHSNSHRKVLEMRRKKEVEIGVAEPV